MLYVLSTADLQFMEIPYFTATDITNWFSRRLYLPGTPYNYNLWFNSTFQYVIKIMLYGTSVLSALSNDVNTTLY